MLHEMGRKKGWQFEVEINIAVPANPAHSRVVILLCAFLFLNSWYYKYNEKKCKQTENNDDFRNAAGNYPVVAGFRQV